MSYYDSEPTMRRLMHLIPHRIERWSSSEHSNPLEEFAATSAINCANTYLFIDRFFPTESTHTLVLTLVHWTIFDVLEAIGSVRREWAGKCNLERLECLVRPFSTLGGKLKLNSTHAQAKNLQRLATRYYTGF